MDAGLEDSLRAAFRAWARTEARTRFGGTEHVIRKQVEEKMERFPAVLLSLDTLMRSRVARVSLLLVGEQPVPRVQMACGKRRYTLEPYRLTESALEVLMRLDSNQRWNFPVKPLLDALEPLLQPHLASVRADVTNAVATALVDDRLVGPVKDKLAKQRELARLNAVEAVKHQFRNVQHLLSKEDVTRAWDEVLVARVMES
jgi:hypothetical protein